MNEHIPRVYIQLHTRFQNSIDLQLMLQDLYLILHHIVAKSSSNLDTNLLLLKTLGEAKNASMVERRTLVTAFLFHIHFYRYNILPFNPTDTTF